MPSYTGPPAGVQERWISLGDNLAKIPERLLLAHARGEVLFIAGAGISMPAGLPDFRSLVVDVYERLDSAVHQVLQTVPNQACNRWSPQAGQLNDAQRAEAQRFVLGDYDVVLGMLERRIEGAARATSKVRHAVSDILRTKANKPANIHKALVRLADRGTTGTIVTTNFDVLLEVAARRLRKPLKTHALGAIPRASKSDDFSGVLHIHGVLPSDPEIAGDLIVTDQDFGEFYLHRRVVPDFIYDAARLFHLVLVGYSANDAPMRYLLNAVAADVSRFGDLKERFAFVGGPSPVDAVSIEDWKGRGITPIPYRAANNHSELGDVLDRWADLLANGSTSNRVDRELKRIARRSPAATAEVDRDLFDHLIRRVNPTERTRLAVLLSKAGSDLAWLDRLLDVSREASKGT